MSSSNANEENVIIIKEAPAKELLDKKAWMDEARRNGWNLPGDDALLSILYDARLDAEGKLNRDYANELSRFASTKVLTFERRQKAIDRLGNELNDQKEDSLENNRHSFTEAQEKALAEIQLESACSKFLGKAYLIENNVMTLEGKLGEAPYKKVHSPATAEALVLWAKRDYIAPTDEAFTEKGLSPRAVAKAMYDKMLTAAEKGKNAPAEDQYYVVSVGSLMGRVKNTLLTNMDIKGHEEEIRTANSIFDEEVKKELTLFKSLQPERYAKHDKEREEYLSSVEKAGWTDKYYGDRKYFETLFNSRYDKDMNVIPEVDKAIKEFAIDIKNPKTRLERKEAYYKVISSIPENQRTEAQKEFLGFKYTATEKRFSGREEFLSKAAQFGFGASDEDLRIIYERLATNKDFISIVEEEMNKGINKNYSQHSVTADSPIVHLQRQDIFSRIKKIADKALKGNETRKRKTMKILDRLIAENAAEAEKEKAALERPNAEILNTEPPKNGNAINEPPKSENTKNESNEPPKTETVNNEQPKTEPVKPVNATKPFRELFMEKAVSLGWNRPEDERILNEAVDLFEMGKNAKSPYLADYANILKPFMQKTTFLHRASVLNQVRTSVNLLIRNNENVEAAKKLSERLAEEIHAVRTIGVVLKPYSYFLDAKGNIKSDIKNNTSLPAEAECMALSRLCAGLSGDAKEEIIRKNGLSPRAFVAVLQEKMAVALKAVEESPGMEDGAKKAFRDLSQTLNGTKIVLGAEEQAEEKKAAAVIDDFVKNELQSFRLLNYDLTEKLKTEKSEYLKAVKEAGWDELYHNDSKYFEKLFGCRYDKEGNVIPDIDNAIRKFSFDWNDLSTRKAVKEKFIKLIRAIPEDKRTASQEQFIDYAGRDGAENFIKEREKFVDAAYSKGWGASKEDLRAIYGFCNVSGLQAYLNNELAAGTNINYQAWPVSEDSPLVHLQRHEFFSRLKEEVEETEAGVDSFSKERKDNALKVINRLIEENAAEAEKERPKYKSLLDEYEKSVNEKLSPLNIREFSDQDFNKLLDVNVNYSWGDSETGRAFKVALTDVYLQRFTIKAARDDYDKQDSLPMKGLLLKLHETAGAFLDGANALKGLPNDVKAAAGVINPDALKRYEARAEKEKQEAEEKEKKAREDREKREREEAEARKKAEEDRVRWEKSRHGLPRADVNTNLIAETYDSQTTLSDQVWLTYLNDYRSGLQDLGKFIPEDERKDLSFNPEGSSGAGEKESLKEQIKGTGDRLFTKHGINEYKNFFRMQGRLLTKMEASLGREYKDIYDSLSGKNRDLKADYLAETINLREKSVAFNHALTEIHNTHEKSMKKRLMKTLGIDKEDLTLKRLFEKMGLSEERQREELALLKDKGNFSLESMARDLYQGEGQLDSLRDYAFSVFMRTYINEGREIEANNLSGAEKEMLDLGRNFDERQRKEAEYGPISGWIKDEGEKLANGLRKAFLVNELHRTTAVIQGRKPMGVHPDTEIGNFYKYDMGQERGYLSDIIKGKKAVNSAIIDVLSDRSRDAFLRNSQKKQPENYGNYILMHTGYRGGKTREEMADNLSKVMAASLLSKDGEKFDKKRVRSMAANIKTFFALEDMREDELKEGLRDAASAEKAGEKRAREIYNVAAIDYTHFLDIAKVKEFEYTPFFTYNMKVNDVTSFTNSIATMYNIFIGTKTAPVIYELISKLGEGFLMDDNDENDDMEEELKKDGSRNRGQQSFVTDNDFKWKELDKDLWALKEKLENELASYSDGSLEKSILQYLNFGVKSIIAREHRDTIDNVKNTSARFPAGRVMGKSADFNYTVKVTDKEMENVPKDNAQYTFAPWSSQKVARHSRKELQESADKLGFSTIYDAAIRNMEAYREFYGLVGMGLPLTKEQERVIKNKLSGENLYTLNALLKANIQDSKDKTLLRIFDDKEGQYLGAAGSINQRGYGADIKQLELFEKYMHSSLPIMGCMSYYELVLEADGLINELQGSLDENKELLQPIMDAAKALREKLEKLPPENASEAEMNSWKEELRKAMEECIEKSDEAKRGRLSDKELDNLREKIDKRTATFKDKYIPAIVRLGEELTREVINERNGFLRQAIRDTELIAEQFKFNKYQKNSGHYSRELNRNLNTLKDVLAKGSKMNLAELNSALEGLAKRARLDYEAAIKNTKTAKNANTYLAPLMEWAENSYAYIRGRVSIAEVKSIFIDESLALQLAVAENRIPELSNDEGNVIREEGSSSADIEAADRLRERLKREQANIIDRMEQHTMHLTHVNVEDLEKARDEAIKTREINDISTGLKLSGFDKVNDAAFVEALTAMVQKGGVPKDDAAIALDNALKEKLMSIGNPVVERDWSGNVKKKAEKSKEEKEAERKALIEDIAGFIERRGAGDFIRNYPEQMRALYTEWNALHPGEPLKNFPGMVEEQHVDFEPDVDAIVPEPPKVPPVPYNVPFNGVGRQQPPVAEKPIAQPEQLQNGVQQPPVAEQPAVQEAQQPPVAEQPAEQPAKKELDLNNDYWRVAKYGLSFEIRQGDSVVTLDNFLRAGVDAGWAEHEHDIQILRNIYMLCELCGNFGLLNDVVNNDLRNRGEILDRLVTDLEAKSAYYGGSYFNDREKELKEIYKARNELNPDKEPIEFHKGSLSKGNLPIVRGQGLSTEDRTYNELRNKENRHDYERLIEEIISINSKMAGEEADITEEDRAKAEGVKRYVADLKQRISARTRPGTVFDPAENKDLALFFQKLGQYMAQHQFKLGAFRLSTMNDLIRDYRMFKEDPNKAKRLTDSIVIGTQGDLKKNYDAMKKLSDSLTGNLNNVPLANGQSFSEWVASQQEMGRKNHRIDYCIDMHKHADDYKISIDKGAEPVDPAARGEYGFVVNSNYTNMAGSNIFLRKPVEAMIDDSRIGNREAILQAYIRDQNILKKGIARFKKGADKVAIECRNKFQRLSRMKPIFWKHTDGAEFVNMKNSLDRLQQIQNGDISVDDLKQRLSDLKRDAHNYNVSHRGFFKANPGYGANRFEMSEELERYADQCLKNMLTAPKNMLSVPKDMVSYETTAEQITLLESNVEKLQAELAKENPEARAQAQNAPRNGGNRIGLEGLGNRVNNGHNANNNNVDYHALRNQNRESAANNMQLNVINNEDEPIIKAAGE